MRANRKVVRAKYVALLVQYLSGRDEIVLDTLLADDDHLLVGGTLVGLVLEGNLLNKILKD